MAAFTRSQVQLLGPALSPHSARTHFARQVQGTLRQVFDPASPGLFLEPVVKNGGNKWATIFITVGLDEDMEDLKKYLQFRELWDRNRV